jgi:hypothetical protein
MMTKPSENRRNPWTHALVASCAVFIFTVFLMLSAAFNRDAANMARFFDRHGMLVLSVEVGAILGLTIVVLVMERRQTLQQLAERERALLDVPPRNAAAESSAAQLQSPSGAERP